MSLRVALGVTCAIAILECAGGFAARSIALLADSAHVFMDAVALGIAVFAQIQARRPANDRRSFGYARFEVLAALGNGALLVAVISVVALEAIRRIGTPMVPEGGLMATVAAIGFAANVCLGLSLFKSARENLNVKAAFYHVAGDAVGAAAVAIGGLVVLATHATWIDPVISLGVAVLVIAGVVHIVRDAVEVLLESAPAHASIPAVRTSLRALPGVVDVHDLHVWTIGSGSHVLTAHVLLADARISDASTILRSIEERAHEAFGIDHVTVQFECESCTPDDVIVCTGRVDSKM